jgi:hypothetical protein
MRRDLPTASAKDGGGAALSCYDSRGVGGKQVREKYVHVSYIILGRGLRIATMRIVGGRGGRPRKILYPGLADPCSERGFALYQAGRRNELRLRTPSSSQRRLRRFLRDFVRSQGGATWSTNIWVTSWR